LPGKSGTTTLHVAAYGVPMVVVYRASRCLWHLVARWVVKTPSIALVNILAERSAEGSGVRRRRIVRRLFLVRVDEPVAELAIDYLNNAEKRRSRGRST